MLVKSCPQDRWNVDKSVDKCSNLWITSGKHGGRPQGPPPPVHTTPAPTEPRPFPTILYNLRYKPRRRQALTRKTAGEAMITLRWTSGDLELLSDNGKRYEIVDDIF